MLAPIVLFTYNRPVHTRKTIEALGKNYLATKSDLIIYSDGWKNEIDRAKVEEVRTYLKTITGFKSVIIHEKEKNSGLAPSLIAGISEILATNEKIIVVEDDLVTSPYALTFLNDALEIYKNDKNVGTIHAHVENIKGLPELFFYNKSGCLVWATWARVWKEVSFDGEKLLQEIISQKRAHEFNINGSYPYTETLKEQIEGKNSSWAILVYASLFLKNKLTLYSGESLVQHIGYDTGTHEGGAAKASDIDGFITQKEITAKISKNGTKAADLNVGANSEITDGLKKLTEADKLDLDAIKKIFDLVAPRYESTLNKMYKTDGVKFNKI